MENETIAPEAQQAAAALGKRQYRKRADYEPMDVRQDGMMEIPYCEPDQEPKAVVSDIEVVTDLRHATLLEHEKFLNEQVEVYIHPTSEKNADRAFTISVNGVSELFLRGQKRHVKRRFVFGLATARPTTYSNEEYTDVNGARAYRWPTYTGLRYPFSVINDTVKGVEWLDQVMKSPN